MKLEVGDIVKETNTFCIYTYEIKRVTKTKAIGVEVHKGFESSFKREYVDNEHIKAWKPQRFDMTNRVLIKK